MLPRSPECGVLVPRPARTWHDLGAVRGLIAYFRENPQVFVLLVVCVVLGLGTFIAVIISLIASGNTQTTGEPSGVISFLLTFRSLGLAWPRRDPVARSVASRPRSSAHGESAVGAGRAATRGATVPGRRSRSQRSGRRCGCEMKL